MICTPPGMIPPSAHRPQPHRVNITHPDRRCMGCGAACTGIVPSRVATAAGREAAPVKETAGDVGIGKKGLGELQEGVNKVCGRRYAIGCRRQALASKVGQ